MPSTVNRPSKSMGFALGFELGLGGLALLIAWLLSIPLAGQLRLDGSQLLSGLVATVPMLGGFWCLMRATWRPLQQLRQFVERLVAELFGQPTLLQLAVLSLAAGIGEELLFRGVLQPLVTRWSTPFWGLIVASLVFGLAHSLSTVYFLLATAVGLYLGGLAMMTGGLVAPMLAHGLYDFVALWCLCRSTAVQPPDAQIEPN